MKRLREVISGPMFKVLGYRPQSVSVAAWNREYRDGEWKYLETIGSLAGQVSILGYCQFLAPATILDVGCGTGLLAAKLKILPFQSLLGIDISPEAIAQAKALEDERTAFAVCAADAFHSDKRFDVIVFNQCMNYMADPAQTIAHFLQVLAPEGRMIVSLCENPRNRAAWPLLERDMDVEDATTYIQAEGRGTTKVLKRRAA